MIVQIASAIEFDLCVETRNDTARDAQTLQLLAVDLAHGDYAIPKYEVRIGLLYVGIHGGQRVPALEQHRFAARARDVAPNLDGGETQERREPAHHRLDDVIHRRLRRSPRDAVGLRCVLAVLDDVEIKAAHLHHAEIV